MDRRPPAHAARAPRAGRTLVDRFAGVRLAVVGDALVDTYLDGRADRLSRDSPVPVVDLDLVRDHAGGAANTAANARALGAHVELVALVGTDPAAAALDAVLDAADVGTRHVVRDRARRTLRIQRVRAGGQPIVRIDEGDTDAPPADVVAALAAAAADAVASADAVIVSDYAKGVLGPAVREAVFATARRRRIPVVVDAKDVGSYRRLLAACTAVTAVKPNWREVRELLGGWDGEDRIAGLVGRGPELHERTGAAIVAVTLDRDGALVFERGRAPHRTRTHARPETAAIGAGDTFVATFALALAAGAACGEAASLATLAAGEAVATADTAICTAAALRRRLGEHAKVALDVAELGQRLAVDRAAGRTVAFVNGCFDLLHGGHVALLEQAALLADVLVVAVNADAGVARLKGPGRPVLPLEERLSLLGALAVVDHLVVFEEDSPDALLRAVCPDVYAKGLEYSPDTLPEAPLLADLGIPVTFLGPEPDVVTGALLDRLRTPVSARR